MVMCIDFLYIILHGVYIMGTMNYILVGGLILLFMYHHLRVYFLILVMYILVLFLLYILVEICFIFCMPISLLT